MASYNYRAMVKVAIVATLLTWGITQHWPAIDIAARWSEDAAYYMHNNSTKMEFHNLTPQAKMAFLVIPLGYIVPIMAYYLLSTRSHRKKLFLNGWTEGTVMWVYGMRTDSHIYDLLCVFRGFRNIAWDEIKLPVSGDHYKGKIIIYYKLSWLENPMAWHRIAVANPSQVRVGLYKVWVEGVFNRLYKPSLDPTVDYTEYFDEQPFDYFKPDLDLFNKYHKASLNRVRADNIEMMQSNPEIIGGMIESSLFVVPGQTKAEFLELLPKEVQEKYIREGYAQLQQTK